MWFALQARVDSHRAELMADAEQARTVRLARRARAAARRQKRSPTCGEPVAAGSATPVPAPALTPSS